jgi:hypothetical protein
LRTRENFEQQSGAWSFSLLLIINVLYIFIRPIDYCYCKGRVTTSKPGSLVNFVSAYGLDDRAIEIRSPAEVRGIFV